MSFSEVENNFFCYYSQICQRDPCICCRSCNCFPCLCRLPKLLPPCPVCFSSPCECQLLASSNIGCSRQLPCDGGKPFGGSCNDSLKRQRPMKTAAAWTDIKNSEEELLNRLWTLVQNRGTWRLFTWFYCIDSKKCFRKCYHPFPFIPGRGVRNKRASRKIARLNALYQSSCSTSGLKEAELKKILMENDKLANEKNMLQKEKTKIREILARCDC